VIGTAALLRLLPQVRTDRERLLSLLRSRSLVTHADAIEALWGKEANGGPLYAQHILAIYVSRLRRAGHSIENYRGIGYRIPKPASGIAADQVLC
jgi:DNA-binding response OmpR family regulator